MKKFLVLDGSSLIFRAFYALPAMTAPDGTYTNALHGFCAMLARLLREQAPDYLAIAFDKSRHTFRTEKYAEYKGTRKAVPPELKQQMPLLEEFARVAGIRFIEMDGWEADDIIGTMATEAAQKGIDAYVVTGDRDALQLVRPNLSVLFTKHGTSDIVCYDRDVFFDEYGLEPLKLIDLKGLMGDSSDNIPGVPGVGPKTASKLLKEYGSLESVLGHAGDISGKKLSQRLIDFSEQAMLSKDLATIRCNVPVEFTAEECVINPEANAFHDFCVKYGLKSVEERLTPLLFEDSSIPVSKTIPVPEIHSAGSIELERFYSEAEKQGMFCFTIESEGRVPSVSVTRMALATGEFIVYADGSQLDDPILYKLFSDDRLTIVTDDVKFFYHAGKKWLEGDNGLKLFQYDGFDQRRIHDIGLMAYLIDPAFGKYTPEKLAGVYINDEQLPETGSDKERMALEVTLIRRLYPLLRDRLKKTRMDKLYSDVELPLSKTLYAMENAGIYIDIESLEKQSADVKDKLSILESEIYDMAKGEFNINSPKQLSEILFGRLGLTPVKKTKSGYSTNAEVLEKLRFEHPIVEKILQYRMWGKLESTYLGALGGMISPVTHRLHAQFNQMATATGRLSSSDPNLQNIPVRTEEGRMVRAVFEPGEGYDYLLSADYSQIELRVLAHLSGDSNFVHAFSNGQDIHARTASEVFGVPIEDVTSEQRRKAKAVNFGIVYGISDFGLARSLGISRKEAAGYISKYLETCSGVKKFMDAIIEAARNDGYVTTMSGRRRKLPDIHSSNFNKRSMAERMAMNTPIQGSAADIIKIAMNNVYDRLIKEGLRSRILVQVHDELLLEVPESELEQVKGLLKDEMEHAAKLSVPLVVDLAYGHTWAEAK
ncbi:MAG: DNA polymerase I [Veillonellaceae bacterium]|nr:DNA polymerase I [Veillonellaceae bacterium]